ncbi:MAG: GAF domain-containing protein [Flavobacteriia bacterium]|jgi:L-methionine (R)-S-oxide reductase
MAEDLFVSGENKTQLYQSLLPQIKALVGDEQNVIANLANISAALKSTFSFFWVGFYLVQKDELVLGPFQGSVACTRIAFGRGVCGASWKEKKTLLVPSVDEFPGHIACSSLSKSEIVVPIIKNGQVIAVLDVDSDKLDDFDETDKLYLEEICQWIATFA